MQIFNRPGLFEVYDINAVGVGIVDHNRRLLAKAMGRARIEHPGISLEAILYYMGMSADYGPIEATAAEGLFDFRYRSVIYGYGSSANVDLEKIPLEPPSDLAECLDDAELFAVIVPEDTSGLQALQGLHSGRTAEIACVYHEVDLVFPEFRGGAANMIQMIVSVRNKPKFH